MDPFLPLDNHRLPKRDIAMKICSGISLLVMIGIIYLQYDSTGLYDSIEQDYKVAFEAWKVEYNKTYVSRDEDDFKFNIFKQNYKEIQRWNLNTDKTTRLAVNKFADLNREEFRAICCSYEPDDESNITRTSLNPGSIHVSYNWSKSIDFKHSNAKFFDSWATSVVSSIESIYSISQSKKLTLSVDQILYCQNNLSTPKPGNFSATYDYILEYGLMLANESRLSPDEKNTCNYDPKVQIYTINGYRFLESNNDEQVELAVNKQPVVTAVQANEFVIQFYSEGIIDSDDCGEDVNQAVLITGYGHDDESGKDFWIVQNYWGKNWGLDGFFKLERGDGNTCGVLSYPSYPVL